MARWAAAFFASALALALALTLTSPRRADAQAGVHPISGRVYALPMSVAGAEWLDRADRETEEEPSRAVVRLGLKRGDIVADVGAGSGYMSEKLAKEVGPSGRVYATDIQPGMVALIERRIAQKRLTNITPILGTPDDPGLPERALDLLLMVDVYHELQDPQAMLAVVRRALKPTGRLVLLEYRGEDPRVPIRPEHKMTVATAKLEIEAEGFRLEKVDPVLPRQHILSFRPVERSAR
jgi:ubiquinone/menaquinone biosynthesis C-methylase UbiE